MGLFLKPKQGNKPLMQRFGAFTEKVKSVQGRLRENKRLKIKEETERLREQISLAKSQEKLERLRLRVSKKSGNGFGGGFGGYYK